MRKSSLKYLIVCFLYLLSCKDEHPHSTSTVCFLEGEFRVNERMVGLEYGDPTITYELKQELDTLDCKGRVKHYCDFFYQLDEAESIEQLDSLMEYFERNSQGEGCKLNGLIFYMCLFHDLGVFGYPSIELISKDKDTEIYVVVKYIKSWEALVDKIEKKRVKLKVKHIGTQRCLVDYHFYEFIEVVE